MTHNIIGVVVVVTTKKDNCGCYYPKFKEQMIFKIKRHFETLEEMKATYNDLI